MMESGPNVFKPPGGTLAQVRGPKPPFVHVKVMQVITDLSLPHAPGIFCNSKLSSLINVF